MHLPPGVKEQTRELFPSLHQRQHLDFSIHNQNHPFINGKGPIKDHITKGNVHIKGDWERFFTDPSLVIMIMVTNMGMRMMFMVMMEMQCVHAVD